MDEIEENQATVTFQVHQTRGREAGGHPTGPGARDGSAVSGLHRALRGRRQLRGEGGVPTEDADTEEGQRGGGGDQAATGTGLVRKD